MMLRLPTTKSQCNDRYKDLLTGQLTSILCDWSFLTFRDLWLTTRTWEFMQLPFLLLFFGFRSCTEQVCSTLVDANYSLRGCIISSARQGNQCLLWFASFVTEIKVLELRKTSSGQWQQPIYTTLLQLILILDHPLYLIYFIRSCTSPRPVTPGDAISAATLLVPPQHNQRVQGIEWSGLGFTKW